MLSLWHTHGSAPRSSYLPCHVLARWERSELEQETETPPGKITRADVVPVSLLSGVFLVLSGQCNTGAPVDRPGRSCIAV